MNRFLAVFTALLIALPTLAQKKGGGKKSMWPNGDAKRWMVGVQGGTNYLHADVNKSGFGYVAGLTVQHSFSHTFGVRLLGNYGAISGELDKTGFPYTSYKFKGTFWEAQGQAVFTLGNISYLRAARKGNLYFAAGLGVINNKSYSEFINRGDPQNVTNRDTFEKMNVAFSISTGWRYSLNQNIALGVEYNFRYSGTDEMDILNPVSPANKSKDGISMLQVSLNFKLGKKGSDHIEWVNPVETIFEDISKIEKKVEELSKDDDGDGVSNTFDKDNTTPMGAKVYGNGEAVDSDGDGVADANDEEPNSPKGAVVDPQGKAEDGDKDGVADVLDMSPNTDTSLLVNHQGIPIMTKDLARKMSNKGGGTGGLGYMPALLFESGSTEIKPIHYADLSSIAEAIKRNSGLKITIIGNADFTGSEKINEQLGLKRAEAVRKVLVENFGVDAGILEIATNGEKVPVAKGKDPLSLAANRRVQFFVAE